MWISDTTKKAEVTRATRGTCSWSIFRSPIAVPAAVATAPAHKTATPAGELDNTAS